MEELDCIELFIDEEKELDGIEAISLVEFPAIEENWVALNKHEVKFKTIDADKRIIIGLALVPDKKIYRRNKDYEYNIVFSKDTVRKASELYLKKLKLNNTTLEHQSLTSGVSVVESWIVEDTEKDKTSLYNLNAPLGAWAVTMKIYNDDVWKDVKEGKYLGFSIEGIFSDEMEQDLSEQEAEQIIKDVIKAFEDESEVL
jgi:hypothetical protein